VNDDVFNKVTMVSTVIGPVVTGTEEISACCVTVLKGNVPTTLPPESLTITVVCEKFTVDGSIFPNDTDPYEVTCPASPSQ
jgi:hypothetical protein